MKSEKIIKKWANSSKHKQMSLRISFHQYAPFLALQKLYGRQALNEMLNDVFKIGAEKIIAELPPNKKLDENDIKEMFEEELLRYEKLNDFMPYKKPLFEDYKKFLGTEEGKRVEFERGYNLEMNRDTLLPQWLQLGDEK